MSGSCLPFLATMFHAVGLNVIDAKESKSDVLDTSRKALGDMIAKVVVKEKGETHKGVAKSRVNNSTLIVPAEILRTYR